MSYLEDIQNAGGKLVWVALSVITFFTGWQWKGCNSSQDEAEAVQLAIYDQKDSCEARLASERKFWINKVDEIGLELINAQEQNKKIQPPSRPIHKGNSSDDVHKEIIAALAHSVDSLKRLATIKLMPREIPNYPFEFENQFIKLGGSLWGKYYPLTEQSELTHKFIKFEIKQMLEREKIVEVNVENTGFFNSLTMGLHFGYEMEKKKSLSMFEIYPKLRVGHNMYLVPRYDMRYTNKELARTISFGFCYTIQ